MHRVSDSRLSRRLLCSGRGTRRGCLRERLPCRARYSAGPPCRSRRRARLRRRGLGPHPALRRAGSCRRAPGTATAGAGHTEPRSPFPTAVEPVKPTLSTSPSSRAFSSPSKASFPSAWTTFRTPSGRPPFSMIWAKASAMAGEYSAGFHTTALPQARAGTMYQEGNGGWEVAGGNDRRHPDRHPEGEELLVRHLGGNGLTVEPAALAGKEVAGVYYFLDFAQRLPCRSCRSRGSRGGRVVPCLPRRDDRSALWSSTGSGPARRPTLSAPPAPSGTPR